MIQEFLRGQQEKEHHVVKDALVLKYGKPLLPPFQLIAGGKEGNMRVDTNAIVIQGA